MKVGDVVICEIAAEKWVAIVKPPVPEKTYATSPTIYFRSE